MKEITIAGDIKVSLSKHKRSKSLKVWVDHKGKVKATMPYYMPYWTGQLFIKEKESWIIKQLSHVKENIVAPRKLTLANNSTIPYQGKELIINYIIQTKKRIKIEKASDQLLIYISERDKNNNELIRKALFSWYKQEAKTLMEQKVNLYAAMYGLRHNKITIRDQKTIWGSCNNKGNLNFSWRIILLPERVADYLVVHEVCHLREMNHSSRFWSLVEQTIPEYKMYRKYLRDNSLKLNNLL